MKIVSIILGMASVSCIVAAHQLAFHGKGHWGWFLLSAVIIAVITTITAEIES
jgi:hypothetical protein